MALPTEHARGLLQYMERENRFHLHFHHKEVGSHHFHRSVVAKVHLVVVVEVDVVEAELVVELLVLEVDVARAELVVELLVLEVDVVRAELVV